MSKNLVQSGRPGSIDQTVVDNSQIPIDLFVLNGADTKNPTISLKAPWKWTGTIPESYYYETRYKRSASQPTVPSVLDPLDWTVVMPTGAELLWMTRALRTATGALAMNFLNTTVPFYVGPRWTTPVRLNGPVMAVDAKSSPRYLGAFVSTPSGANSGDWFFYTGTTVLPYTNNNFYSFDGVIWTIDTDPMHISSALSDLVNIAANANATVQFINNLVVNNAFISSLSTKKIISDNKTGIATFIPIVDRDLPRVEFDLHNSTLTMRDDAPGPANEFRKTVLGPANGILVTDKNGATIHDIPQKANGTDYFNAGHLVLFSLDQVRIYFLDSQAGTGTVTYSGNLDVTNYINNPNVKALHLHAYCIAQGVSNLYHGVIVNTSFLYNNFSVPYIKQISRFGNSSTDDDIILPMIMPIHKVGSNYYISFTVWLGKAGTSGRRTFELYIVGEYV